ncbi:hypothetical protein B0I21_11132 [Sphingobacterium paludis]|uniref:Uncharacterized protein n=1 Tax=Sphingobacterium paludis TaxID=1476465 RepID=A0A4V6PZW1_9SPHI|nr:hypothetical protein B0I21_11132 [Sphingobacterium paludis]
MFPFTVVVCVPPQMGRYIFLKQGLTLLFTKDVNKIYG